MREKKTINTTSIIGQVNNSITTDGCAVEQARAKNIPNQSLHNGTSIKQQLPLNHFFKIISYYTYILIIILILSWNVFMYALLYPAFCEEFTYICLIFKSANDRCFKMLFL